MDTDVIATRRLTVGGHSAEIIISIYKPQPVGDDFSCNFTIDWGGTIESGSVYGIDALQSLSLCIQRIGAIIYTSNRYDLENIRWLDESKGFGLILPKSLRDLYIGDDVNL